MNTLMELATIDSFNERYLEAYRRAVSVYKGKDKVRFTFEDKTSYSVPRCGKVIAAEEQLFS